MDHDTIEFNLTIDGSEAQTRTWVVAQRIPKLEPTQKFRSFSACGRKRDPLSKELVRVPAAAPSK